MIPAAQFVFDRVINPALQDGSNEIRQKASTANRYLKACNYAGDVYLYMRKSTSNANEEDAFRKAGLESFETIMNDFEKAFGGELGDISTVHDLVKDNTYNSYEVAVHIHNYAIQKGITYGKDEVNFENNAIIIKGEMSQKGKYPNKWLDKDRGKLFYFFRKNEGEETANIYSPLHEKIINNSHPIYFFETTHNANEGNTYTYRGPVVSTELQEEIIGKDETPTHGIVLVMVDSLEVQDKINISKENGLKFNEPDRSLSPPSFNLYDELNLERKDGRKRSDQNRKSGDRSEVIAKNILTNNSFEDIELRNYSGYDILANKKENKYYIEVKSFGSSQSIYLSIIQIRAILEKQVRLGLVDSNHKKPVLYLSKNINEDNSMFKTLLEDIKLKASEISNILVQQSNENVSFNSFDIEVRISKEMLLNDFDQLT